MTRWRRVKWLVYRYIIWIGCPRNRIYTKERERDREESENPKGEEKAQEGKRGKGWEVRKAFYWFSASSSACIFSGVLSLLFVECRYVRHVNCTLSPKNRSIPAICPVQTGNIFNSFRICNVLKKSRAKKLGKNNYCLLTKLLIGNFYILPVVGARKLHKLSKGFLTLKILKGLKIHAKLKPRKLR